MKKILYIAATSFLLSLLAQPVRAAEDSKPVEFVIEDFDPAKQSDNEKVTGFIPGVFPYDWRYRNSKAKSIFGVLKEGDKYFVKARSFNTGIQILKKIDVELKDFPVFSWKWRIIKFPGNGVITEKLKGDNGGSVYVIFSGFIFRSVIKYAWSNYYSKETFIDKNSRMKIIVLRDKNDPLNSWLIENRNILEDYKKFFGKDAPSISAIAIMTDSDETNSYAEADYANFKMIQH